MCSVPSHSRIRRVPTYIIAAVLVLVVAVEKGLGIDVPGVDVGSDWLTQILAALGLGTLRAGITGANK